MLSFDARVFAWTVAVLVVLALVASHRVASRSLFGTKAILCARDALVRRRASWRRRISAISVAQTLDARAGVDVADLAQRFATAVVYALHTEISRTVALLPFAAVVVPQTLGAEPARVTRGQSCFRAVRVLDAAAPRWLTWLTWFTRFTWLTRFTWRLSRAVFPCTAVGRGTAVASAAHRAIAALGAVTVPIAIA
jgi:hypothetical protein